MRWWAFWRRVQYSIGFCVFFGLVGSLIYVVYIYQPPTCADGMDNGDERGVDCGGSCLRICPFDVLEPEILWAESFRIAPGQYNAVAYIENRNITAGSPEVRYTFSFYDERGLITERSNVTVLPPDSVYPIFEGRISTGERIPTRTEIVIEDIDNWYGAETGREQFVIERRELKDADKSPRLNAAITNTALTEARDVEIVATIFNRAGDPLTASRTVVPRFAPRTTEEVVFTWPEPIAKTVRSCEVPSDVVLAIDLSGSMNDDGGDPPEPVSSVLRAAESFVKRLGKNDMVSVVTYATNAELVLPLTNNREEVAGVVANLLISKEAETGSTNTGDAITKSKEELASSRHNPNARKVLVLLTDGLATAPATSPEEYAKNAATQIKNDGVEVYTIGLGAKVNTAFLEVIASGPDHHFVAPTTVTIGDIYTSITSALCEEGAAVIEIVPKTKASFRTK